MFSSWKWSNLHDTIVSQRDKSEIELKNSIFVDKYDIYFVGDGAGKAGNIVTAAATGLVAARDILERI